MTHIVKPTDTTQFVGCSQWAHHLRQQIRQVSQHPYSVLITGPSGTGKEVAARSIHDLSPRAKFPFIPVNCAAIPQTLFASQLFGHVKGAFTGAQFAALGCFRAADGGTIFLDEIAELDLDSQAQLLRVLQEKLVTPVGSHESVPINVRTIVATNRYLPDEVREGRFRLDLYYRLNVLTIETIGLAARIEDIEILADHFLAKIALETGMPLKRLTSEALTLLQSHAWPGNVRELQNRLERAVVHSDSDLIAADAFAELLPKSAARFVQAKILPGGFIQAVHPPAEIPDEDDLQTQPSSRAGAPGETLSLQAKNFASPTLNTYDEDATWETWPTLDDVERRHIEQTLTATFHNQSAAARMLGVDRKLLARKIKKYGIQRENLAWKSASISPAATAHAPKPR